MNYMNIMALIKELHKSIKDENRMSKFHTYASHLDEYSYPQICKIYDAINSKVYEKIKWKGILDFNVKMLYAFFV